jgi:hypothetical protein
VVTFSRMETHEIKTEKTPVRDFFLRTVAVLGLIAILLLGAWGIIQLAFAIPTVFSNFGGSVSSLFTSSPSTATPSTKEAITVSMPASAANGQTVTVSWMHANADKNGQYSYAISYACQAGLSLKAPLPNGSFQSVPCNTLFNYVNASQHMDIVPSVTGASQPLTITVTATKLSTGTVSAQGTATTNVTAKAAATTAPTTTTKPVTTTKPATTYYPAATRATTLYGYGDLATTITSVSPSNGVTVVKFMIANTGTNIINAGWTFNATLPINGSYTFGSQPQQALYPGDKIAYTLSFAGTNSASQYGYNNNPYGYSTGYQTGNGYTSTGYNCTGYVCTNNNVVTNGYPYGTSNYGYNTGYQTATILITADPQNFVQEYNKGNNTAQTTVPLY